MATIDEKLKSGSLRLIQENVNGLGLRLVRETWSGKQFYVDENGNSWGAKNFTAEKAAEASRSLVDCRECDNCINCENCSFCVACVDCKDCLECYSCRGCVHCHKCLDCEDCVRCSGCGYSKNAERRKKTDYINHPRIEEEVKFGDYGYLWSV